MHAAPSVNYPVGRSRFAGALLAGLWATALAALLAWHWQAAAPAWQRLAGFALLAACGALAGWGWRRAPAGTLGWTGAGWLWNGRPGRLALALDLQSRLLLRWQAA